MSVLLILAALCFAIVIGLFAKYGDSHNDGDMWAGILMSYVLLAGLVLSGVAGVWWASQHIFFK